MTPTLDSALLAEFDQPVGLGTVIEVDTTRTVNVDELTKTFRQNWAISKLRIPEVSDCLTFLAYGTHPARRSRIGIMAVMPTRHLVTGGTPWLNASSAGC